MKRHSSHRDDGVSAKKHLGQHFLKDPNISQRIAGLMTTGLAKTILEVGPGTGALTRPLLSRFGKAVHVIELDRESVAYLKSSEWIDSTRVHEGDLLRSTPESLGLTESFSIVGNFPYNISSQILFRVLDWRHQVPECVGMFQKEVADRICAAHGSKTYGILSVLMQVYYKCDYVFTVGPEAFLPPPKVQSGVIQLVRTPDQDPDVDYETLRKVVKAGFGQRRKTLRNALRAGGYDANSIPEDWRSKRAEQLSPRDFVILAKAMTSAN